MDENMLFNKNERNLLEFLVNIAEIEHFDQLENKNIDLENLKQKINYFHK